MPKVGLMLGNGAVEPGKHVMDDIGIGILVYCNSGRGVWAVNDAQAFFDAAIVEGLADLFRDFNEGVALAGANFKSFHRVSSLRSFLRPTLLPNYL
jgi:hypothetical protein